MRKFSILAIDTSCDDTAVSIIENDCVLSNIVSSQVDIHSEWGGVVPGLAKRAHQERIASCVDIALKRSRKTFADLCAIAVTYGPGLAPALEVGVQEAKNLAAYHNKPLIAVNHMEGHLLSPLLKNRNGNYYSTIKSVEFPIIAMSVSGGHTEIVWVKNIGDYKILGQTVDDAAGEAFDKIARMLGLGYPGGAIIERMAESGNREKIALPRPMSKSNNYNFSFSGLKTASLYKIRDLKKELKDDFAKITIDFCASVQEAIVDSLLIKLFKASKKLNPHMVWVAGGVSANNRLRYKFRTKLKELNIPVIFPAKQFCMDNAAMIGLVAYHKYKKNEFVKDIQALDRDPSITIECSNVYE